MYVIPTPTTLVLKKKGLLYLECSLNLKGHFNEFEAIMQEYLDMGHAERVPFEDMNKPEHEVFYLPMHAVHKSFSTRTNVNASAKSSSGACPEMHGHGAKIIPSRAPAECITAYGNKNSSPSGD